MDTYGIEVKIAVSPSPDNKYVFVDYYVYDKNGQGGSTGRTIKMGTGTDVMIGAPRKMTMQRYIKMTEVFIWSTSMSKPPLTASQTTAALG